MSHLYVYSMQATRQFHGREVGPRSPPVPDDVPPGCLLTTGFPRTPGASPFDEGFLPKGSCFPNGKFSISACYDPANVGEGAASSSHVQAPVIGRRRATRSINAAKEKCRNALWEWHTAQEAMPINAAPVEEPLKSKRRKKDGS